MLDNKVPFEVLCYIEDSMRESMRSLLKIDSLGNWDDYNTYEYYRLLKVWDFYLGHWDHTTKHFRQRFEEFKNTIEANHFIYDFTTYYRFTLITKMSEGTIIENCNSLLKIDSSDPQQIETGRVLKVNGVYIKIIDASDSIDKKYGKFIAQSLSVSEILNLKKGEN